MKLFLGLVLLANVSFGANGTKVYQCSSNGESLYSDSCLESITVTISDDQSKAGIFSNMGPECNGENFAMGVGQIDESYSPQSKLRAKAQRYAVMTEARCQTNLITFPSVQRGFERAKIVLEAVKDCGYKQVKYECFREQ